MANEDRAAGTWKQVKGKAKEVTGAATGDRSKEFEGTVEKDVGKVQDKLGKADNKMRREEDRD